MRHHNPTSTSCTASIFGRYGKPVTVPYLNSNYSFTKPSPTRTYIKVIKYVAEHPNCKRVDIQHAVWKINPEVGAKYLRGDNSSLFAVLLYRDFIDYNDKYEYTVTGKGLKLLKEAGIAEINISKKIVL